jgi:UMF1 family MFS transporter
MNDFANSAFDTTILAVIFNQYFATVVARGRGVEFLGFHLHGASFFTFSVSLSRAISAVLAPFLGAVADAIGNKRTVIISLAIWSLIVIWAFCLGIIWDPQTEYWILGVLAGIVMGGSQAASRSLQGIFTPDTNSAEFFGFFAVSGKFASVFGPLIYGILIALTGSVR